MKRVFLWGTTLWVLVCVNFLILDKERTLATGRIMLLRLAPVDPRSLIQGDYMVLRYKLANSVPKNQLEDKGHIVVSLDENHVARFIRVYDGGPLRAGEHLLLYRNRGGPRFGAESFFFQEGDATLYAGARYGELRVDKIGASVLVGLRGENFKPLRKKMSSHDGAKVSDGIKGLREPKAAVVHPVKPKPPSAHVVQSPKVIRRKSAPEARHFSSSTGVIIEHRKSSLLRDASQGKSLDMPTDLHQKDAE